MTQIQRFTRKLPCKLTPDEISQRKDSLVEIDRQINETLGAKARVMAEHNEALRDKRATQRTLLENINTGTETREVDCWSEPDFPTNRMVTYRADNREQIEERALTADERQASMFDANKGKDKGSGGGSKKPEPEGGKIVHLGPGNRPKKRRGAGATDEAPAETKPAEDATAATADATEPPSDASEPAADAPPLEPAEGVADGTTTETELQPAELGTGTSEPAE